MNHVKNVRLPYTAIDVGWWYQITLPRLASGRIDYATTLVTDGIGGDGNMLSAITDVRDIGAYVARIIADPRTLNHMVFAYNELITQNQVYDLLEKMSGEKVERNHVSSVQSKNRSIVTKRSTDIGLGNQGRGRSDGGF